MEVRKGEREKVQENKWQNTSTIRVGTKDVGHHVVGRFVTIDKYCTVLGRTSHTLVLILGDY